MSFTPSAVPGVAVPGSARPGGLPFVQALYDSDAFTGVDDTLQSTNLLSANAASMETDMSAWGQDGVTTQTWSTAQAHAGTHSLDLIYSGPFGGQGPTTILNTPVTGVTAGQTYTFSVWLFSPGTAQINLEIDWRDGSGTYLDYMDTVRLRGSWDTASAGWSQITLTTAAVAGAAQATLLISPIGVGTHFNLDDVFLGLATANPAITSSAPDTGSAAEATSIHFNLTQTDTGSGAETTNAVVSPVSSSDTGSALDNQGNPMVSAAGDTGSGSETANTTHVALSSSDASSIGVDSNGSVHVALSASDASSAAVDVESTRATILLTDTTSGAEGVPSIAQTTSDTGSGTEGAIPNIAIVASDTATGTESANSSTAALSTTDAAAAAEATAISISESVPDLGSFSDAQSLRVNITVADAGSSLEDANNGFHAVDSDSASGAEASAIQAQISTADTASALDTAFVKVSSSDSASAVEIESITFGLLSTESAVVSEFSFVNATLSDTDTGSFADDGSGGSAGSDAGTFSETAFFSATTSDTDTGSFADSTTAVIINGSDSFAGADDNAPTRIIPNSTEVVSALEIASARIASLVTETVVASDASFIRAQINNANVPDSFTAVEDEGILFSVSDDDESSSTLDSQVVRVILSAADSISSIDNVTRINLAATDSVGLLDQSAIVAKVSSIDTAQAGGESTVVHVGLSDTISAADTAFIKVSSTDTLHAIEGSGITGIKTGDTATVIESAKIRQTTGDTGTAIESARIHVSSGDNITYDEEASFTLFAIAKFDTDTATASEAFTIKLRTSDAVTATEKLTIGVSDADQWDPLEEAVIGITSFDVVRFIDVQSPHSGPPYAVDAVLATEDASVRLLYINSEERLGPRKNPLAPIQPYYLRRNESWAVDNERQRHLQALYLYGEWTMFVLMWHQEDLNNGLVQHCIRCYGAPGQARTRENRESAAFGNTSQYRCPDCFGTTFEGGYKAIIVRPAIFADTDENQQYGPRGLVNAGTLDMESTPDFRVRTGDYSFRSTGDRYQLQVPERVTLRTGFATPYQRADAIGYNHAKASIEDPQSVAYSVPPSKQDLKSILNVQDSYTPIDFSAFEVIRSPLIPIGDDQG